MNTVLVPVPYEVLRPTLNGDDTIVVRLMETNPEIRPGGEPQRGTLLLPGPVQPSPIQVAPASHSLKDGLLVVLLMAFAGAVGYGGRVWQDFNERQLTAVATTEGAITLPSQIELEAGGEPKEITAQTRGRRIIWQAPSDVIVRQYTDKSAWVWSSKPGKYKMIAFSAVNDLPVVSDECIVNVTEAKK